MIKIEFTCYSCEKTSDIDADDIDGKTVVPVCDDCYSKFLLRKARLIKSFGKKLASIYGEYDIPVDTFNASEDIIIGEVK